jgi:hypothetical protein
MVCGKKPSLSRESKMLVEVIAVSEVVTEVNRRVGRGVGMTAGWPVAR